MADVLRRAVRGHIAQPTEDVLAIRSAPGVTASPTTGSAATSTTRAGPSDALDRPARERLRQQLAEDVRRQREDARRRADRRRDGRDRPIARRSRRSSTHVWPALDRAGPARPALHRPDLLAALRARPCSTDDEQRRSPGRRRPRSVRAAPLDRRRRGADRRARPACSTAVPAYVHVVVDEAQDLSPMQCRADRPPVPARLGDRARRPGPGDHAVGAGLVGESRCGHLGHAEAEVRPLTAGYRVPGEVLRPGQPAAAARRRRRAARDLRRAPGTAHCHPPGLTISSAPSPGAWPARVPSR